MSYYFTLQWKRFNRFLIEFGIAPVIGYLLIFVLFILMSAYIFYKAGSYAEWVYLIAAILVIEGFGAQQSRYALLKSIFEQSTFFKVRLIENAFLAIPFALFLLYKKAYFFAILIVTIGVLLAFIPLYKIYRFRILTPFKKQPFEFTAGYRKTILYFPMILFVLVKSIQVGNGNLALFTLGFLFFISLSYYITAEPHYFAWIHDKSPRAFLQYKIGFGIRNVTVLIVPVIMLLLFFFPETWRAIIVIVVLGYAFIIQMILAKYSAFPSSINLPQIILFSLSIWFPPMLLIVIPIFYKRAISKLNPILS